MPRSRKVESQAQQQQQQQQQQQPGAKAETKKRKRGEKGVTVKGEEWGEGADVAENAQEDGVEPGKRRLRAGGGGGSKVSKGLVEGIEIKKETGKRDARARGMGVGKASAAKGGGRKGKRSA